MLVPSDVPPGNFGPQTAATLAMLHGRYRLSDREIPQLLHDLFGLPISLGSVVNLQQIVSAASAPIATAIQATVRALLERGQRRYDQAQGLSTELLAL